MLKKEIKKILENMDTHEEINFHSIGNQGWRTDRVSRVGATEYRIYSSGQGWSDQVTEEFSFKDTLKIIWSSRPQSAIEN